jgi:hypothetical protein
MSDMIMIDSDDAATYQTGLSGWVSRHGLFFGDDERAARFNGCTHVHCSACGAPTPNSYTHCEACRKSRRIERFNALESRPWDGRDPVYLFDHDEFFFDEQAFLDWCDADDTDPASVRLVFAEPVVHPGFDASYFDNHMPEDWDYCLPDRIQQALDALNVAIRDAGPMCWREGKVRAVWTPGGEG